MGSQTAEITGLLRAWSGGEPAALDRLTPFVYQQLRRLAGRCMQNENSARTIQATALAHEAWLRLVQANGVDWQNRAQFFALSGKIMRNILVDNARARRSVKRGGQPARVELDELPDPAGPQGRETAALHDALEALARGDPRRARIIDLRFFAGLSVEETAAVLGVSPETVMRDARVARAWLKRELSGRH